jgi:hypothetical protein
LRRGSAGILPKALVGIKTPENSRQGLIIIALRHNEAVHTVANQSGDAGVGGSYDGQAASHSFGDGQAKGIFAAGADVEINGGVEVEHILAGRFKAAALENAKRFSRLTERIRRIVAGGDQENRQIAESGHGAENGFQSLHAPIVSNQEQHEIRFLKFAAQALFGTPGEPRGRRKLRGVHAIGNDPDILPVKILNVKIIAKERGSALGDGDERDFGVRIDMALPCCKKGVVGAAVELPKKAGAWRGAALFARQFPETMEEHVNEDDVGVQTVDSGRENKVEPQSVDHAIPRTTERIQEKPGDELQEVGAGGGGDSVPEDRSRLLREVDTRLSKREALDPLGVEMNLAMLMARESFEKLGKGALRSMAAVNEG